MKESKFKEGMAVYNNMWQTLKMNARHEGRSPMALLAKNILKTLAMTIPGFIVVWLFPIKADETYGWLSGVWHGWFALCNMIIRLFSPDTFYAAPLSTTGYEVWWWICCVYAILLLFAILLWPMMSYRDKRDFTFEAPAEPADSSTSNATSSLTNSDLEVKTSIANRTIKVFISSTFQDMQEERDYLMTHVFPHLKDMAARRNVQFVPVDLRWGITEEESKSGKVLELCLQEIDNARPFFIGIIGKRYGWCPSVDEFTKSDILQKKYPWTEQDFKQHLSVTEMEIQYGVLRRKEHINAIFFTTTTNTFLLSNQDSEAGRIDRLKKAIVMDGRYPLINAVGAEQVGQRILDLFINYLDKYFPEVEAAPQQNSPHTNHDGDSVKSFISDYLSHFGKKLSASQMDTILASPLIDDKNILETLLDELVKFGKFEELDCHIAFLLEAVTPSQFYQKILECYESQYNQREVCDFFSIMRLTGYGLKVKDVLDIADVEEMPIAIDGNDIISSPLSFFKSIAKGVTNLQKKPFDMYFQMYLKRDGEFITLSHEAMQKAVDERYLTDDKQVRKYRKKIKEGLDFHTNMLKDSDENLGLFEEIAYQMLMLGQRDELKDFMEEDVVHRYFKRYRPELYSHFS